MLINSILSILGDDIINNFNYTHAHTKDIMDKIEDTLKWLFDKKLNVDISRYSRYTNYINDFYQERPSLDKMEEKFKKLTMAFQELYEIVQIYNSFKDENGNDFNERLKKIIQGKDLITESATTNKDFSRDFLYELMVAAYFKSKGFRIDFNSNADVVARKNEDTLFIECKKLKSKNSLEQNFKKAGKQLSLRTKENTYGLIFIDITNCISEQIKFYEYSSILEMKSVVQTVISEYCKANNKIITTLNDRFVNDSLAVCMTFNKCLWMSNLQINPYRDIEVRASSNLSDKLYDKLNILLSSS